MQRVQPGPRYELVVDQIRRAIHIGRFLPGEKLPPERNLAEQLGVSRTTVREAARVLEGEGLVEIRRGATGGLFVLSRELSDEGLRATIKSNLQEFEDILDFRIVTESGAVRLAAQRRTKSDLDGMRRALAEMDEIAGQTERRHLVESVARFRAIDSEFHIRVARASKNPLLVKAVEDARVALFLPIGAVFGHLEDNANEFHSAVAEAIERRDGDAAAAAIRAHIEATRSDIMDFVERRWTLDEVKDAEG